MEAPCNYEAEERERWETLGVTFPLDPVPFDTGTRLFAFTIIKKPHSLILRGIRFPYIFPFHFS